LSRDAIDTKELARLVERGEYVVDHRAVAEAILRRTGESRATRSGVLEARQLDGLPIIAQHRHARAGGDLA